MVANQATKAEAWVAAVVAPILLLQGTEDKIAPPENARRFKQQYGARVTLVEISNAAHAMLPEQPEAIAKAIVNFLQR
jgi:pimeloyl-ACP methyl ester carboxylesterase